MVSPEGRVFGRPATRQALNRVYQYVVPKAATKRASNPRWSGYAGSTNYVTDGSLDARWIKVLENAKVTLNLNDEYGTYAIAPVAGVLVETLLPLASRAQFNIEFAAI